MFAHFFKPLTDKELLQIALNGLHSKNVVLHDRQVAENRVNVHNKWAGTVAYIDYLTNLKQKQKVA